MASLHASCCSKQLVDKCEIWFSRLFKNATPHYGCTQITAAAPSCSPHGGTWRWILFTDHAAAAAPAALSWCDTRVTGRLAHTQRERVQWVKWMYCSKDVNHCLNEPLHHGFMASSILADDIKYFLTLHSDFCGFKWWRHKKCIRTFETKRRDSSVKHILKTFYRRSYEQC